MNIVPNAVREFLNVALCQIKEIPRRKLLGMTWFLRLKKKKKIFKPEPYQNPSKIVPNFLKKPPKEALNQKIAICLHIFYEDFIDIFANLLKQFPYDFDLFCTVKNESYEKQALRKFKELKHIQQTHIKVVPNRGRNFAPLFIEYGKELLAYDLMCHLHSKKSLYSGSEQKAWAEYLLKYLLPQSDLLKQIIHIFAKEPNFGVYYPVTFRGFPGWVNSWGKNKALGNKLWKELNIPSPSTSLPTNFINYPVGGMFWARPKAIQQLLTHSWQYTDFPAEPLANDGTLAHTIERMIGQQADTNGYKQFYYDPNIGDFTTDRYHYSAYYRIGITGLLDRLKNYQIISFDLFDTLAMRRYFFPDYAKLQLGNLLKKQGLVAAAQDFVKLRNETEGELRSTKRPRADVKVEEVYEKLAVKLNIPLEQALQYSQYEFEYDLEQLLPKEPMITLFNHLGQEGKKLWIVSDTYYSEKQAHLILKKIGVMVPYELFISSKHLKRKDTGEMWSFLHKHKIPKHMNFIHIGDNGVSDSQIPGDFGLANLHILNPYDKWTLLEMPRVSEDGDLDENTILKWGRLIACMGRNPFLGEL